MPLSKPLALLLLVILWSPPLADAQATGTIAGAVSDETGALVPGAKVTATHTSTSVAQCTTTDHEGKYELRLAPGSYDVKAEQVGFAAAEVRGVLVRSGKTVTVDLTLRSTGLEETQPAMTVEKRP
jgi:hypothetical protein